MLESNLDEFVLCGEGVSVIELAGEGEVVLFEVVPFWFVIAEVEVVVVVSLASPKSQLPLYDSQVKLFRQHFTFDLYPFIY